MRVFHTNIEEKYKKSNIGFVFIALAVILIVFYLVSLIFIFPKIDVIAKKDIENIKTTISLLVFLLLFVGVGKLNVKGTIKDDLKVFVLDDYNNFYMIKKFSANYVGNKYDYSGGIAGTLFSITDMLFTFNSAKNKMDKLRDPKVIMSNLKDENLVKSIEILKDTGDTIEVLFETNDGDFNNVLLTTEFNDYETLFFIIRSRGITENKTC